MAKTNGSKTDGVWQIILVYVFSRFLLTLIGILGMFYFPSARTIFPVGDLQYHQTQPRPIEMWARWDSEWYILIAEKGYASYDTFRNAAGGRYLPQETAKFFPAYPMLIRIFSLLIHNSVLSGLIVSNFAAILFLYFFYQLSMKLLDDQTAFRGSLFYILFPTSFFLTAVYSESLFLAAVAAAFYFVEQKRLLPALPAVALLILSRPQGIIVMPFLLWLAVMRFSDMRFRALLILLLVAGVSLGGYLFYIDRTFGSFRWIADSQAYWRGNLKYPFYAFVRLAQSNVAIHGQHNSLIDFSFAIGQLLILLFSVRKLPAPYLLYSAAAIAFPLSSSLFSFSRLCLVNFPFFIYLGYRLHGRLAFLLQITFAFLLSFFMAAFANWYWVG